MFSFRPFPRRTFFSSRNAMNAPGLASMPRCYFYLPQNGCLTADEEGEELPDLAAAEREAAVVAAHLTEELFKGAGLEFSIDVRDDRGQIIARANVSLDVASLHLCQRH